MWRSVEVNIDQRELTMTNSTARFNSILTTCLLSLGFLSSGNAVANEKPSLKAFTSEDAYPYNFQFKKQLQGLVYDVAKTLVGRAGFSLQAEAQPWTRALQTAKDTPNVMVFSLARNPEREDSYYWIGPITSSEVWLFKLKARKEIQVKSIDDIKDYVIGDIASSSTITLLNKFKAKIDTAPSNVSNCRKFKANRVDLIPFDPNGIKIFLHTCGLMPEDVEQVLHLPRDTSLFIAMSKKSDKALVEQLQNEFQIMTKDKTLQRIHETWKVDYKALQP